MKQKILNKNKIKKNNGITLIALVITIIVLLILAAISIAMLTGQNGILTQAQNAKNRTEEAKNKELSDLAILEQYINQYANGDWDSNKKVNSPKLTSGMTPIMFTDPTEEEVGQTISLGETGFDQNNWYNYEEKRWANVELEDGSMFVWIPRFAYKITYNDTNDKSKGGTIDVRFLEGTSNTYYDDEGNPQTALRVSSKDEVADTENNYYVHPAFTNESNIDYANGGWDSELTGIWVAKFEAGYASGNNDTNPVKSNVTYTQSDAYIGKTELGVTSDNNGEARNWLDGIYGENETKISYPTFQGVTYSMNYININDAYNISKELTASGNPYGLSSSTDSHLMKNSEWGAVAYLGWSRYGSNGTEMFVNNITLNSGGQKRENDEGKSGVDSVYAVTGLTTGKTDEKEKTISESDIESINNRTGNNAVNTVYAWNQETGQKSSTTLNIYGIFDMSGGLWERTAGYVANENKTLKNNGESLTYDGETLKLISTKYETVYPHDASVDNTEMANDNEHLNAASTSNYLLNTKIYGDAIREISSVATGISSWNSNYSNFFGLYSPFAAHGGNFDGKSNAGSFAFSRTDGNSGYHVGFRPVLIAL